MRTEPLTIKHKQLIISRLQEIGSMYSDMTFGNLYLWRKEYKSQVAWYEDIVGVRRRARDGKELWVPLDKVEEKVESYQKLLEGVRGLHLYPITLECAEMFPKEKFAIETNEGWNDYVYQTKKIADFTGRALNGKRNHVHHFVENYPYKIVPFTKEVEKEAVALLDVWKGAHQNHDDYEVCLEAIKECNQVGLEGIAVMVEGKMVGFISGQALNPKSFDVQFAKGDIHYKGVYPFLFQQLAKTRKEEWINYEVDLGLPGLQKSKMEYAPDHYEVKWRVHRK